MSELQRVASLTRTTDETDISIALDLDGSGMTDINTGVPFFDHMLNAFARHGHFDLKVRAQGDLEVDAHHTVEDVGIVLGNAFDQALDTRRGITRFADVCIPMDESLILAACDISGRGQLFYTVPLAQQMLGTYDTDLTKEFFIAFASHAGVTLHVRKLAGENAHHIVEAVFKATGRAMSQACSIDPRVVDAIPSTKGAL